jgi:hypothetical protein
MENNLNTSAQGHSQGVCTPLGNKMTGGGYRTKKLFTGLRIFSAGGHPFRKFLVMPLHLLDTEMKGTSITNSNR